MIIPMRCYSCGKPIAQSWEQYQKRVNEGEDAKNVLDDLGFDRYCCRRMILSHSDIVDEIIQHKRF
ncbi:MAG: DNA-directed RNA polymerase subunit N [Candidatus Altiarchaeales archaeon]|nr:DNA-directed RNA polymerase subunit N [Candidatus Altiarchaeales archaeon]